VVQSPFDTPAQASPALVEALAQPSPRFIKTPQDAEGLAADWMRYFGFVDARANTTHSADGGIDVRSSEAVAQVKMHGRKASRPDLQRLTAAASAEQRRPLFFSQAGFARPAADWAAEQGVALFEFDYAGGIEPINDLARGIMAGQMREGHARLRDMEGLLHRLEPQEASPAKPMRTRGDMSRRIDDFITSATGTFTNADVRSSTGVAGGTVKWRLSTLAEQGVIERVGHGMYRVSTPGTPIE
jgi:hypothetical protein